MRERENTLLTVGGLGKAPEHNSGELLATQSDCGHNLQSPAVFLPPARDAEPISVHCKSAP